ncbi:T9SS type A sorting domain-containing protein [bacterium]|nr:T9SS type A sorting domain-containing protein [bacterium]
MFRKCAIVVLAVVFPHLMLAQNPAQQEIRISEIGAQSEVPLKILHREGDGYWVFWNNGMRRLSEEGLPVGEQKGSYGYSGAGTFMDDGRLVLFHSRPGGGTEFRFLFLQDTVAIDTSAMMFSISSYRDGSGHGTSWWMNRSHAHVISYEKKVFAASGYWMGQYNINGMEGRYAETTLHMWDAPERSLNCLLKFDANSGGRPSNLPAPFIALLQPAGNRALVYIEKHIYGGNRRTFHTLNLVTGEMRQTAYVDTVDFYHRDYNQQLLKQTERQIDLLSRNRDDPGIRVDRIDTADYFIHVRYRLDLPVRLHSISDGYGGLVNEEDHVGNILDYQAASLGGGRKLIVWSEETTNDSSNVYATVYSNAWKQQGSHFRINTETGCQNMGPSLIIRHDTVFVVYYSNREGPYHVYLRAITIDNLLDASAPAQLPSAFSIAAPYPNPVPVTSRYVSVQVDVVRDGAVELALYDMLGRRRSILHRMLQRGSMTMQIPIDGLSPGIYHLRARSADESRFSRLVVR